MTFTTGTFLLFLPAAFFAYWIAPSKCRYIVLMIENYIFYFFACKEYIPLLMLITIFTYMFGELIKKGRLSKFSLHIMCFLIIFPLLYYKYFDFRFDSLNNFSNLFNINFVLKIENLATPLGISFYTLSAISYILDIKENNVKAHSVSFFQFASGLSFFPCLLSGPIQRQQKLVNSIISVRTFCYNKASYGLKKMAWGYFKKLIIAESIMSIVDRIFDNIYAYKGGQLLIVSFLYSFQIYCDFSGYSDIAIGISNLFGIEVEENFCVPYLSKSLKEFWSRWHISLSSWFRDYVYIPLGGNRVSSIKEYLNLLITFFISGLWHGATWNFLIWGGIHGILQILEKFIAKKYRRFKDYSDMGILKKLRILRTFCIVTVTWIVFRCERIVDAKFIVQTIFIDLKDPVAYVKNGMVFLGAITGGGIHLLELLGMIGILIVYDILSYKQELLCRLTNLSIVQRWLIYLLFSFIFLMLLPEEYSSGFIYMQF